MAKHHDAAATAPQVSTDRLLSVLSALPPVRAALATDQVAAIKDRTERLARIKQLEADAGVSADRHRAACASARADADACRKALDAANAELRAAVAAASAASFSFDRAITSERAALKTGADPMIAAFQAELWAAWENILQAARHGPAHAGFDATGRPVLVVDSTIPAAREAASEIRAMIDQVEALYFEPDQVAVVVQIAAMRKTLPSADGLKSVALAVPSPSAPEPLPGKTGRITELT